MPNISKLSLTPVSFNVTIRHSHLFFSKVSTRNRKSDHKPRDCYEKHFRFGVPITAACAKELG